MNRGPGQCNGILKYFKSTGDVVIHSYFVCGDSCFIHGESFTNFNEAENLWIVFVIRENQNTLDNFLISTNLMH